MLNYGPNIVPYTTAYSTSPDGRCRLDAKVKEGITEKKAKLRFAKTKLEMQLEEISGEHEGLELS